MFVKVKALTTSIIPGEKVLLTGDGMGKDAVLTRIALIGDTTIEIDRDDLEDSKIYTVWYFF